MNVCEMVLVRPPPSYHHITSALLSPPSSSDTSTSGGQVAGGQVVKWPGGQEPESMSVNLHLFLSIPAMVVKPE